MKILFKTGNEFAIASHDVKLIHKAQLLSKKYPRKFEFQFLKGIRDEIKSDLIKKKLLFQITFHMVLTGWHIQ